MRALQTGNIDNISVNVDAKPKHYLVPPMDHILSVEFYTCMQGKLDIEILFRIWFDVDSYVQFR